MSVTSVNKAVMVMVMVSGLEKYPYPLIVLVRPFGLIGLIGFDALRLVQVP